MPAIIRPNRLEVNDRFPMLGFTIRTHGEPRRAEVAVATDPTLLAPDGKARRAASNFYSSRAAGTLALPRGAAVFVVPAEVLARFVGAEKLYFGLATAPATGPAVFDVDVMPTADSPYVSLRALTGRSLRRLRVIPGRGRASGDGALDWAGDTAQPGQKPAERANATPTAVPMPASHYDDGFGPLPPAGAPATAAPATGKPATAAPAPPPAAAAKAFAGNVANPAARAMGDDITIGSERRPVTPPPSHALSGVGRAAAEAALLALSGPLAPMIVALRLAARASGAAGTPVSIGVGPSAGAGLFSGGTLGTGVIFGPGGELGVYGSAQFDVGFVTSISLTAQLTVVRGGIDSFSGWSNSATISGGEEIVGGGSALFDDHGNFAGISVQSGVGAGFSPIDFFVSAQRSVATTLGMAAALGQLGPRARTMDADAVDVDIVYRSFIPSPYVDGPTENYGGDGRGFSVDRGTSRGELHARARVAAGGGVTGFTLIDRHFGTSHSFYSDGMASPPGKPSWWLEATGDEATVEKDHATLAATDANLNIAPNATQDGAANFHIILNGANPLLRVAPEINSDLHLFIRQGANGWEAKLTGAHDGFPCHEVYVNRLPLYQYDPVAAGKGPKSLLPPMDIDVDTGWQRMSTVAATADAMAAPRRTARAFDADIPLDPGVGGQSIGMDALQIGDIILSTTDAAISRAIRAATSGQVSHAMLYVDQGGQVVEAVGEGVRLVPLADAIASATVAVAFRVPDLTPVQRQQIADAAGTHIGQDYNRIGIARQALFQIDRRLCSALPNGLSDRCRAFAGRIDMGTQGNDQFFCSELVLDAFQAAGLPLTSDQPNWASPDDIAALRFDYSKLRYIGHLKAAPSGGLFGHLLAYARSRPARAMDAQSFTINWDDVGLVPQSSGDNCWAAAATMIVGWNEQLSIDPSVIARVGAAISFNGQADVASNTRFAQAIGLVAEAPADYTVDGFRTLLETYGPLWVGKVMGSTAPWNASSHAVAVTGMYSDGTDTYLRVSDPWDRVVGSPGAPGSYQSTHVTGSRYIIKYADFMREYDADQQADPATLHTMILHAPGTNGRQPNRGSATAVGYAQAFSPRRMAAPPPTHGAALGLTIGAAPAVSRRTEVTTRDGVEFRLEQLDGMIRPQTQPAVVAPVLSAELSVSDWPRMPDDHGGTFGAVKLAWHYDGSAVGDIRVVPENAGLSDGWTLKVEGRVVDGPGSSTMAAEVVEIRHCFGHGDDPDHHALIRVTVRGDGGHDRTNEWEADPVPIGA